MRAVRAMVIATNQLVVGYFGWKSGGLFFETFIYRLNESQSTTLTSTSHTQPARLTWMDCMTRVEYRLPWNHL